MTEDPRHRGADSAERQIVGGRARKIIVALLLVVGVQAWLLFAGRSGAYWGRNVQLLILLILAALSCVPPVFRGISYLLERAEHPSPAIRRSLALAIAISSSIYLYLDARYQQRSFAPKYQDEFSYMIQTRMVSQGQLWEPQHPQADFFESFQFISQPVYASIYFPGTAMLYAPGIWLGWPQWMMPLIYSGGVVALVFLIFTELIDAVAGVLAALMLLANPLFRLQSLMVMAHVPAMLLSLAIILAWLRWRASRRIGWSILIGVLAGWCAITRPVDALCAAIPVGVAMLIALRRAHLKLIAGSCIAVVAGAAPFLMLQLYFNYSVTGTVLKTPFDLYAEHTFPQTSYGFHRFDPTIRPRSTLPQKQAFYDAVALPVIRSHTPSQLLQNWGDNRLRLTVVANAPTWLMIALMPVGLLGLFEDGRKLVLWLTLPLFVFLYAFYAFFHASYPVIAAAAIVLNILAGAQVLARTWTAARPIIRTFLTLALFSLTISELPEFNRYALDEWFAGPQLAKIDQTLRSLPDTPAIVLFRFAPTANSEEEPVYNTDVVWPDDAQVIRAQDLGARNRELFAYYAAQSPQRFVYLYDRGDDTLTPLGTVSKLALAPGSGPAAIIPPAK